MTCETCDDRLVHGRKDGSPIHCRTCHLTWTGNEAQHCVVCHRTFNGLAPADKHRYHRMSDKRVMDRCDNPEITPGWRQVRPNVWSDAPLKEET